MTLPLLVEQETVRGGGNEYKDVEATENTGRLHDESRREVRPTILFSKADLLLVTPPPTDAARTSFDRIECGLLSG
ncbi:hypothetical protein MMC09_006030 [Bachmanniomyces sp. S44760]|nr:hypothetical protein [Bachmanniomyces sp. S44760]